MANQPLGDPGPARVPVHMDSYPGVRNFLIKPVLEVPALMSSLRENQDRFHAVLRYLHCVVDL